MQQLAVAMAFVAVAIATPIVLDDPASAVPGPTWLALLPVFALAEMVVIHLPTGRSSHSHVLREIPAIAGLTFLAPAQYLSVLVLGAGLALVLHSRVRGLKLAFNLALLSLEATLGVLVYQAVLAGSDPIGVQAWAAAAAAVLVTDLVSAAAITAAISLTEERLDPDVLREAIRTGVPAALVNACVALLTITLVVVRPSAVPLLAVLVGMLALGYRQHVRVARGYSRLTLLREFVGSTGRTEDLEETVGDILAESAALLHAETAELVVLAHADGVGRCFTWHDGTLDDPVAVVDGEDPGARWWSRARQGESVLVRHDPSADRTGEEDSPRDGMAVALRSTEHHGHEVGEVTAVLLVRERSFERETFGPEDLTLFETLAGHAAVALANATMVDRLRRLAEDRERDARQDPLTGLGNRRAFLAALGDVLAREERASVLLLDLDDFKDVNDTLGHGTGDRLLVETGKRLARVSGATGTVARLGGDEFAVLLAGVSRDRALAHARVLHAALSEPVPLDGLELPSSASIGVAEVSARAGSSEDALARADVAMYAAKADRSGVRSYCDADGEDIARRVALAGDLPAAIRDGGLRLYYQPQARTADDAVVGFEALLRWEHPRFGFVPPPEVIAIAHRTGLIRDLTDAVLREALVARARWAAAGHELDVSVNVTPADVVDPALPSRVAAALAATGVPARALVVEVTESDAMLDVERSMEVLGALRTQGVRLSVDDFGTGHSSLAYLERLPVHEVKIDQSFVFRLEHDLADSTIVRATVALAHDLGLRVVAEGVQTPLARGRVGELGCELYQGFGLAHPMPGPAVLGWLTGHEADRLAMRPVVGEATPARA